MSARAAHTLSLKHSRPNTAVQTKLSQTRLLGQGCLDKAAWTSPRDSYPRSLLRLSPLVSRHPLLTSQHSLAHHLPRSVARDLFVHESVEHAARSDALIFISQPIVYSHLQEVFWPSAPTRPDRSPIATVASFFWLFFFNLLALPLLPFLPESWEVSLEQHVRDAQVEATTFPLLLLWLLPSGRFALWFLMTFFLAQLATNIPPDPSVAIQQLKPVASRQRLSLTCLVTRSPRHASSRALFDRVRTSTPAHAPAVAALQMLRTVAVPPLACSLQSLL